MKKTKRILALILAVLMITSSFSLVSTANSIDASKNSCYTPKTVYVVENFDRCGELRINGYDTTNRQVTVGDLACVTITPKTGYYVAAVTAMYYEGCVARCVPGATLVPNIDGSYTYSFHMVCADVSVFVQYAAIDWNVNVTDSNADTAHYVWDEESSKYVFVESLDDEVATQGYVALYNCFFDAYLTEKIFPAPFRCYDRPANGVFHVGDTVLFNVEEYIGYDVSNVGVFYAGGYKGCDVTEYNSETQSYSFTMPVDNVFVKAEFTPETYSIIKDAADEAHGKVLINSLKENIVSESYKDLASVTVTPDEGWYVESINYKMVDGSNKDKISNDKLVDFSEGASYVGTPLTDTLDTEHSLEFYMPATDVEIDVKYAKIDYTISTQVIEEGTGTIVVNSTANVGDEVHAIVTPNYGYVLDKLSFTDVNGKRISYFSDSINQTNGAEFIFTMPASAVQVTATFVKDAYTVYYYDTDNSIIMTEAVKYLEHPTLSAGVATTPNGNHFFGWTSEDTDPAVTAPSLNPEDFVIVRDTKIKAYYVVDKASVIFDETVNGLIENEKIIGSTKDGSITTEYLYGDKVIFKAVPDEGYALDDIVVTTSDIYNNQTLILTVFNEGDGYYSFIVPANYKLAIDSELADNVNVEVTFKKIDYTATAKDNDENGKISLNGLTEAEGVYGYDYLDTVNITVKPDAGYYVESITVTPTDEGATSTEDPEKGYSYTYTADAPAVDDEAPVAKLTFPMPASDVTYTVKYAKCSYSISFSYVANSDAGVGGIAYSNRANQIASVGDKVIITVDPNEGYKCTDCTVLSVNGAKEVPCAFAGEDTDYVCFYSFTMPADAVEVEVFFEEVASRQFVDVRSDDWYYNAIYFNTDRGYFRGYNDEQFGPKDNILRRDVAVVLSRIADVDLTPYTDVRTTFDDVPANSYYEAAIAWGVDKGIFVGYNSAKFGANDYITREQLITMLYNFAEYLECDTTLSGRQLSWMNRYTDLDEISDYAIDAITWAVDANIIEGVTSTTIAPKFNATRAEVAQIVMNFCDHVYNR